MNDPPSPASSVLSDIPPPTKRRRISGSSLSDAEDDDDDDDDEEDKPLAARMATKTAPDGSRTTTSTTTTSGKRSGKKVSSMMSKAQTAPIATPSREQAEMNGQVNGVNGHETQVKVEEKMDESQLTRLATGVTVDTGGTANTAVRRIPNFASAISSPLDIPAYRQNRKGRRYRIAQRHYTNNICGK